MQFKNKLKHFRLILLMIDPGFMKMYYKFLYKPKSNTIDEIFEQTGQQIKDVTFLQIGGNDGYVKDPIFKFVKRFGWKGVIVEPQKEVFTKSLSKTYRFVKNISLENIAIAEKTGIRKLYKIAISDSRWATGLATFNREVLEHQIKRNYVGDRAKREGIELPENLDSYIETEDVNCSTITDILKKHNIPTLNLLQIDTEGFDYEIIKTIDFSILKPNVISFENEHLSEADYSSCKNLLESQGYSIKHIGRDSIAQLG